MQAHLEPSIQNCWSAKDSGPEKIKWESSRRGREEDSMLWAEGTA